MKRIHLFEFTDLDWYPASLRGLQTDYLQFVASLGGAHSYLVPPLRKVMHQARTDEIVDLCSGGAGPWVRLQKELERSGQPVRVTLTDKFPNPAAIRRWSGPEGSVRYRAEPVDALHPPPQLHGVRTLFEGFHHFRPEEAACILRDAMEQRAGLGIFEIVLRPPLAPVLLMLSPLMTLVSYLLLTPFITPRTWPRFLWTYILPVVPIATCWDGIVSLLRVYGLDDLQELLVPLRRRGYAWETGVVAAGTPLFEYVYLLGYPT